MRLKARLYYALIGLTQATGFAGGLDFLAARFLLLRFELVTQSLREY